jgi:hypothetical protein
LRSVARLSIDGGVDLGLRMTAARPRLMATPAATARTKRLVFESETLRRWQGEVTKQADLLLGLTPLTPDWVHDPRETAAAPLPLVRAPPLPGRPGGAARYRSAVLSANSDARLDLVVDGRAALLQARESRAACRLRVSRLGR